MNETNDTRDRVHKHLLPVVVVLLGIAVFAFLALCAEQLIAPRVKDLLTSYSVHAWLPAVFSISLLVILNFVISTASVKRYFLNLAIILGANVILIGATTLVFMRHWDGNGALWALKTASFDSPITALVHVFGAFAITLFINAIYFPEEELDEEMLMRLAQTGFRKREPDRPAVSSTAMPPVIDEAPADVEATAIFSETRAEMPGVEAAQAEDEVLTPQPGAPEAETTADFPVEAEETAAEEAPPSTAEGALYSAAAEVTSTEEQHAPETQPAEEAEEPEPWEEVAEEAEEPKLRQETAEEGEPREVEEARPQPAEAVEKGLPEAALYSTDAEAPPSEPLEEKLPEGPAELPPQVEALDEEPLVPEEMAEAGVPAAAEVEHPPEEGPAFNAQDVARYRDSVIISVEVILSQVPDRFLAMTLDEVKEAVGGGGFIPFPLAEIIEQLPEGVVTWDAHDALKLLPEKAFAWPVAEVADAIPGRKIQLPLSEIISQVPHEELAVTGVPAEESGEEFPNLFHEAAKEEEQLETVTATSEEAPQAPQAPETAGGPPTEAPEASVLISFESILSQLPSADALMNAEDVKRASGGEGLAFPLSELLQQLPEGTVRVDAEDVLLRLPQGTLARSATEVAADLPDRKIELPLSEIVRQLPPETLMITQGITQEEVEEMPDIFREAPPEEDLPAEHEALEGAPAEPEAVEEAVIDAERPAPLEEIIAAPTEREQEAAAEKTDEKIEIPASEIAPLGVSDAEAPEEAGGEVVRIRVESILSQVPPEYLVMGPEEIRCSLGADSLAFPLDEVVPALAEGEVKWDAAEVLSRLPEGSLNKPVEEVAHEMPDGKVVLPLSEIIGSVPPDVLMVGPPVPQEEADEIPDIFHEAAVQGADEEAEVAAPETAPVEETVAKAAEETRDEVVFIRVESILSQVPPEFLAMKTDEISSALGTDGLALPLETLIPTLAEGEAKWDAADLLSRLPEGSLNRPVEDVARGITDGMIILPLSEIVGQIPSETLMVGPEVGEKEVDEMPDIFREAAHEEKEVTVAPEAAEEVPGAESVSEVHVPGDPASAPPVEAPEEVPTAAAETSVKPPEEAQETETEPITELPDQAEVELQTETPEAAPDVEPETLTGQPWETDVELQTEVHEEDKIIFDTEVPEEDEITETTVTEDGPAGFEVMPDEEKPVCDTVTENVDVGQPATIDAPDLMMETQLTPAEEQEAATVSPEAPDAAVEREEPLEPVPQEAAETPAAGPPSVEIVEETLPAPEAEAAPGEIETPVTPEELETAEMQPATEGMDLIPEEKEEEAVPAVTEEGRFEPAEKAAETASVGGETHSYEPVGETGTAPERDTTPLEETSALLGEAPDEALAGKDEGPAEQVPELEEVRARTGAAFAMTDEAGASPDNWGADVPRPPEPTERPKDIPESRPHDYAEDQPDEEYEFDLDEDCIKVSASYILEQLPPNCFSMSIDQIETKLSRPGKLLIPQRVVLPQLSEGIIEVDFMKLLPQFPEKAFIPPVERIVSKLPRGKVELSLREVISQLPLDLLKRSYPPEPEEEIAPVSESFGPTFDMEDKAPQPGLEKEVPGAVGFEEAMRDILDVSPAETREGPAVTSPKEAPEHVEAQMPPFAADEEPVPPAWPAEDRTAGAPAEAVPSTVDDFKLASDKGPLPDEFKMDLSSLDIGPFDVVREQLEDAETAISKAERPVEKQAPPEVHEGIKEAVAKANGPRKETKAPAPAAAGKDAADLIEIPWSEILPLLPNGVLAVPRQDVVDMLDEPSAAFDRHMIISQDPGEGIRVPAAHILSQLPVDVLAGSIGYLEDMFEDQEFELPLEAVMKALPGFEFEAASTPPAPTADAGRSLFEGLDIGEGKEEKAAAEHVEFVEYETTEAETAKAPEKTEEVPREEEKTPVSASPGPESLGGFMSKDEIEEIESLLEEGRGAETTEQESLAAMFGLEGDVEQLEEAEQLDEELERITAAPNAASIQKELQDLPSLETGPPVQEESPPQAAAFEKTVHVELREEGRHALDAATTRMARLNLVHGDVFRANSLNLVVLTDDETPASDVARNVSDPMKMAGGFMARYNLGNLRKLIAIGAEGTVAAIAAGDPDNENFVVAAERDAGMAGQISLYIEKSVTAFIPVFDAVAPGKIKHAITFLSGEDFYVEETAVELSERLTSLLGDTGIRGCKTLRYADGTNLLLCYPEAFSEELLSEAQPLFSPSAVDKMLASLELGHLKSAILMSNDYIITYSSVAGDGLSGVLCIFPRPLREGLARLKAEKASGAVSAGSAGL